jgi:hypothetical protein
MNALKGWLIIGGGDAKDQWFASVRIDERSANLGTFSSFEEARASVDKWLVGRQPVTPQKEQSDRFNN